MKVVSGKASIVTSTESPRCSRTTSVSSTLTFTWITERSEIVSSRPTSFENVPGTATSPSSTESRVTRPAIGASSVVLRRLSLAERTAGLFHRALRGRQVRFRDVERRLGLLELLLRDQVGVLRVKVLGAPQCAVGLVAVGLGLHGRRLRRREDRFGLLQVRLVNRRVDL